MSIKKLYYIIDHNSDYADVTHFEAFDIDDVYRHLFETRFEEFFEHLLVGGYAPYVKMAENYVVSRPHLNIDVDELKKKYDHDEIFGGYELCDLENLGELAIDEIKRLINDISHDGDSVTAYKVGAVDVHKTL